MMNFKKSGLAVLFFMSFFYQNSQAQTQHEVGFRWNDFDTFSIIYKKRKDDKSFMRYRLNRARISFVEANNNQRFLGDFELAIGKENRKELINKFHFIYGIEPVLGFAYGTQNQFSFTRISPALGYVLGVQYTFFEQLIVGIEIIPTLSSSFQFSSNSTTQIQLDAGIRTSGLTLAYQFEK